MDALTNLWRANAKTKAYKNRVSLEVSPLAAMLNPAAAD
jgi:hypothetical protein